MSICNNSQSSRHSIKNLSLRLKIISEFFNLKGSSEKLSQDYEMAINEATELIDSYDEKCASQTILGMRRLLLSLKEKGLNSKSIIEATTLLRLSQNL